MSNFSKKNESQIDYWKIQKTEIPSATLVDNQVEKNIAFRLEENHSKNLKYFYPTISSRCLLIKYSHH